MVDPARLHRRTDSLIRAANSRQKAVTALKQFAAAFRDGHLQVRRPTPAVVQWLEDRLSGSTPELPLRSASERDGAQGATLPVGDHTVRVLRIASFGVDKHTASTSEEFVVTHADNGAATIVGQHTWGAGCGYTNGGLGFRLPPSGLEVRMPDCARVQRTGQNEVAGVEPGVVAGWDSNDPAIERVQKAVEAIRMAMTETQ